MTLILIMIMIKIVLRVCEYIMSRCGRYDHCQHRFKPKKGVIVCVILKLYFRYVYTLYLYFNKRYSRIYFRKIISVRLV
jgi:hypothetical protein